MRFRIEIEHHAAGTATQRCRKPDKFTSATLPGSTADTKTRNHENLLGFSRSRGFVAPACLDALPDELEPELNLPRRERAGNRSERGITAVRCGWREVHPVEQIEHLNPEFRPVL